MIEDDDAGLSQHILQQLFLKLNKIIRKKGGLKHTESPVVGRRLNLGGRMPNALVMGLFPKTGLIPAATLSLALRLRNLFLSNRRRITGSGLRPS